MSYRGFTSKSNRLPAMEELADRLQMLPGVGSKSATKWAYHLLMAPREDAEKLAAAILNVREKIKLCSICGNLTQDSDLCDICRDDERDKDVICVVELPRDVMILEAIGTFNWSYHVLHGIISPIDNVGMEDLTVDMLMGRVGPQTKEVVLATPPCSEGDVTSALIARKLKAAGVPKITRLAYGLPLGASFDAMDHTTLELSMRHRTEM